MQTFAQRRVDVGPRDVRVTRKCMRRSSYSAQRLNRPTDRAISFVSAYDFTIRRSGATASGAVSFQAAFGARKVAAGRLCRCARRLSININVRAPDFTARTCPVARRRYSSDRESPDSRTASAIGTARGSIRNGVVILHIPRVASVHRHCGISR